MILDEQICVGLNKKLSAFVLQIKAEVVQAQPPPNHSLMFA
jgi:hypothetical protein